VWASCFGGLTSLDGQFGLCELDSQTIPTTANCYLAGSNDPVSR
jgi:hypothetical protein